MGFPIILPLSLIVTLVFAIVAILAAILSDPEEASHHAFVALFVFIAACAAVTALITGGLYFSAT